MLKTVACHGAAGLERLGVLQLLETLDASTARVRVIAYHRVDEPDADPDLDPGLISATPAEFTGQMDLIARHYNAISVQHLIDAVAGDRPLPPRAVLITFDDAYADFARHAWPILRARSLPVALFVPTAYPDDDRGPGFWWDRLHAALRRTRRNDIEIEGTDGRPGALALDGTQARRRAFRVFRGITKSMQHGEAMAWVDGLIERLEPALPSLHRVLGWEALARLAAEGVTVCPHGHRHALLTRLTPAEREQDLTESRTRMDAALGGLATTTAMAYPANACDAAVASAVRDAGFQLAFAGRRGIATLPGADPLDLTRLPALRYTPALFRAQLRPSVSRLGRLLDARKAAAAT